MDWQKVTRVLEQVSYFSLWTFLSYLCFVFFALMNIVLGFFVDQALKAADTDLEQVIHEEIETRERVVKDLQRVFHAADSEKRGYVTWSQVKDRLENATVQAYFKTLNLE